MDNYIFSKIKILPGIFPKNLTGEEIKIFVVDQFHYLNSQNTTLQDTNRNFLRIEQNLTTLNWISKNETNFHFKEMANEMNRKAVSDWMKGLTGGKIIHRGIIAKNAGGNLDWLDRNHLNHNFTGESLESLLRLVEIKRKKVLSAFSDDLTFPEKTIEGLLISILFSRFALRHSDLRFLNAALKMNDWYYRLLKNYSNEEMISCLLLSLTEQEIAFNRIIHP